MSTNSDKLCNVCGDVGFCEFLFVFLQFKVVIYVYTQQNISMDSWHAYRVNRFFEEMQRI